MSDEMMIIFVCLRDLLLLLLLFFANATIICLIEFWMLVFVLNFYKFYIYAIKMAVFCCNSYMIMMIIIIIIYTKGQIEKENNIMNHDCGSCVCHVNLQCNSQAAMAIDF